MAADDEQLENGTAGKPEPTGDGQAKPGFVQNAKGGWSAMRELGAAKRGHAEARARLKELSDSKDADAATLAHREQIEGAYESIVAEQTAAIKDAQDAIGRLETDAAAKTDEIAELEQALEDLKKKHEHDLAPYKSLAETAAGRSDDAAKTLSEAKKSLKSAEKAVKDLTDKRDSRLATAKKNYENSQARLTKLQNQLSEMKRDENASAGDVSKLQAEVTNEIARGSAAKDELAAATAEPTEPIEQAQQLARTAKKNFETARKDADEAKDEAKKQQREWQRRADAAAEEEDAQEQKVADANRELTGLKREADDERGKLEVAQATLDEAEDIHAHPEATEELRNRISDTQSAMDVKSREVDAAAQHEREVRERTKGQRVAFIAVAVIAVALIIALIVFIMGQGH